MKPQPLKYCADCHAVIAGPDTPWRVYNAIRYCPKCAKARNRWNKANFQKQRRLDKKEYNRLMRENYRLMQKENAELRQRLAYWENRNQEVSGFV